MNFSKFSSDVALPFLVLGMTFSGCGASGPTPGVPKAEPLPRGANCGSQGSFVQRLTDCSRAPDSLIGNWQILSRQDDKVLYFEPSSGVVIFDPPQVQGREYLEARDFCAKYSPAGLRLRIPTEVEFESFIVDSYASTISLRDSKYWTSTYTGDRSGWLKILNSKGQIAGEGYPIHHESGTLCFAKADNSIDGIREYNQWSSQPFSTRAECLLKDQLSPETIDAMIGNIRTWTDLVCGVGNANVKSATAKLVCKCSHGDEMCFSFTDAIGEQVECLPVSPNP